MKTEIFNHHRTKSGEFSALPIKISPNVDFTFKGKVPLEIGSLIKDFCGEELHTPAWSQDIELTIGTPPMHRRMSKNRKGNSPELIIF